MSHYVIGLDYGSDSVRALLVDTADGRELASHVVNYPRWGKGLYCAPQQDQFRQHPQDYLDGLEQVLQGLWQRAPAGCAAPARRGRRGCGRHRPDAAQRQRPRDADRREERAQHRPALNRY